MNILYAKAILYAYPDIDEVIVQIDDLVERKAYLSFQNYSPALGQYERIVKLTYDKDIISAVRMVCDRALRKFTEEELKFFKYKYFKNMSNREKENFDYSSRTYFRRQKKLTETFALLLEGYGIDDKFFEEQCLEINFFRYLLSRTRELEKYSKEGKNIKNPATD